MTVPMRKRLTRMRTTVVSLERRARALVGDIVERESGECRKKDLLRDDCQDAGGAVLLAL